jgi:hypothetical protein
MVSQFLLSMRFKPCTCKGYFHQQLCLCTNLIRWYKHRYIRRLCHTDLSEVDLQYLYAMWQDAEERRRNIIMMFMCF